MQRDTTGEFMSENSKYTVLNGYSETKLVCLYLDMSLNVFWVFKCHIPLLVYTKLTKL